MFEDFRLKVFVTLVSQKSFTRAAADLGVSQPAVSQHISELERNLGIKLFDRLRGEVVLTPEGKVFQKFAEGILEKYSESEAFFRHYPETSVKVCASGEIFDYLLNHVLADFLLTHPEISFEQTLLDDNADLKISFSPVGNRKGMAELNCHPSPVFAETQLWKTINYLFANLL